MIYFLYAHFIPWFQGIPMDCGDRWWLHIVKVRKPCKPKGSGSRSGLFHDKSSCNQWFGGSSCHHPCCPGFGFGVANQQGVDPAAAARQWCRSERSPGAWDCEQHVPIARWLGLRCFKCLKHAVESPSNVTQQMPGAGFGTHGKQSGCRWLESGHDMLCAVVKFGSCNELTTFITLTHIMQFKTVWCLNRQWLMHCRVILQAQAGHAEARLGHRRAFRPEVIMYENEGF